MLCSHLIVSQSSRTASALGALSPHFKDHHKGKQQRKRRNTHEANPLASIEIAHRASQPFCDQVHTRYNDQRHEEGEGQTEDDGPGKRLPEHCIITTEEDMWIQFGEHSDKVDIETYCQRNERRGWPPLPSAIQE